MGPLGESHLVGRVPFVPAEPDKDKRSRDPHVQGVPAPSRVADDRAHAQASESCPHLLGLRASFKPFVVPEFHRHPKFPVADLVGCHCGGMLGHRVGRSWMKAGPSLSPRAKSPSMKSSVARRSR